jgi:hypothetical protein
LRFRIAVMRIRIQIWIQLVIEYGSVSSFSL